MTERPNIYKLIPKKYLEQKHYNPNKYQMQHPHRTCIIGSSGSGKTQTLLWHINESKNYHRIYLYAKNLEEPLYQYLIDKFEDIITYSNKIDDIVSVDELEKSLQNLIIFDNLITEKNLRRVSEIFIRSRKQNCSVLFISQRYHAIPQDVRLNSNYFIFMSGVSGRDLINIATDQASAISNEKFKELYRKATSEGDFLLVDKKTTDNKLKFRKNFETSISS